MARFAARRKATPVVLQMEIVECGAASLAMVLAAHGRQLPLEELRIACGVSRDGSKASKILEAARRYGLAAQGVKAEPEQLSREAPLPLIAFVDFNHFLVVEGFTADKVLVVDPAHGRMALSADQFDDRFTGVALLLEPTDAFETGDKAPSPLRMLVEELGRARLATAFAVLASVALVLPGIVLPVFSRIFVDELLLGGATDWLWYLLLGMAGTAAVRALLVGLQQGCLLRLESWLATTASDRFMRHLLALPMSFFRQRHAAELGPRLELNQTTARLLSRKLATHALNLVSMVFFGAVMLLYDVTLSLVAFAFTAIAVLVLWAANRRMAEAFQKLTLDRVQLYATATAGLASIESTKASGLEDHLFRRLAAAQDQLTGAEQGLGRVRLATGLTPFLLNALNVAAVLGIGSLHVMQGDLTIGTLVAFQTLLASFTSPITGLLTIGADYQEARSGLARLADSWRCAVAPECVAAPLPIAGLTKLSGLAEIEGLRFGYDPNEPPLVDGIDLVIRPGERVALVGRSGSGKSTIARLLAGLEEPSAGRILLDGMPLAELPRPVLRGSLAMVDQEIVLLEGSVRDNIALLDDSLDIDAIVAAARDAGLHQTIMSRAGGYEALLDADGRNLSGGQRQRLDIARALVQEPTLLILDEATSALDAEAEAGVMRAIRRRGCACLIVAHRLSSIRDCDRIHVVEAGRIVESGDHASLMAKGGAYAALIAATGIAATGIAATGIGATSP